MQQVPRSVSSRVWAAFAVVVLTCAASPWLTDADAGQICSVSPATVVCNLPSGDNNAVVQDDGTPNNNKSEIVVGATTTTFVNPSQSLIVNGGGATDTLTLAPTDTFNGADVTIGSEGTVHADTLTTSGTLRITAGQVDQPSGRLRVGALGANTVTGTAIGQAINAIGTFAGSASGSGASVSVAASPLSVGTVPPSGSFAGADGITTNNGDLTLSTQGSSLGLSRTLSAGTGTLTATCSTNCTIDASGGSLDGSPVTLSGTRTINVTDENTTGTGPLIIDGGGAGTANVVRSSVSQSPDSGLVLDDLASATVTGGNFSSNAKEGILVENSQSATIGGSGAGQPNVISGNGTNGVTATSSSGVQLVQNAIFANQALGISLQGGANHGIGAPTLSAAAPSGSSTHVTGSLQGPAGDTFRVEFFDNPACDSSGFGEGRTFIGSANVATDGSGNASFDFTVPGSSAAADAVAATATDLATGDTSQFSQCIPPSPPSISVSTPSAAAGYKLGQLVAAHFSCTEGTRGPGIALCLAIGNNGALVDTRTPGPHTFTVIALSRDGLSATQSVNYTVISPPPNQFTVSRKKVNHTTGVVTFNVSVPGPGTVKAVETMLSAGRLFVSGRAHGTSHRRQTLHVTIRPNGRGLRLVRHHRRLVSLQIIVTFTPTGGGPRSARFALALPVTPPVRR